MRSAAVTLAGHQMRYDVREYVHKYLPSDDIEGIGT